MINSKSVTVWVSNNRITDPTGGGTGFVSSFFLYEGWIMQQYKTIGKKAADEFTEQRSRFIGYVCPVKNEEEALAFINDIKKKHWDARHNVYAYVLREGGIQRYSDDGEPHGTAGVPVLDVILKSGVTDAAVVVTRYFGGILLGAGGLVRAYTKSARLALEAGNIITMKVCNVCRITCDYNQYGRLSGLIPSCGGVIDNTDFGENIIIEFHISPENYGSFTKQLADITCGSIEPEITDEDFFEME